MLDILIKSFYLFIILPLLFFSCVGESNNKGNKDIIQTIINNDYFVVDLDSPEYKDSICFSSFFKSVTCFRLDDKNEKSLIGKVNKFIAFNEKLYVLDSHIAKSLFVFNRDGKFVRKIGNLGQGPGEYTGIYDFTINFDQNEIILLDSHKILFFDLEGKYLRSFNIKKDYYSSINSIQYCNGFLYSCIFPIAEKKKEDYLLQSINMNNGVVVNNFLKSDVHNKGFNGAFKSDYFLSKLVPPYLFRHIFMDTIFSITEKGMFPYIALMSKDLTINKDIEMQKNFDPYSFPEFLINLNTKNKIFLISNFFETLDYFYFQYRKSMNDNGLVYVFFDKNRKTIQQSSVLRNDMVFKSGQPFVPYRFIFYDQKGVYEVIEDRRFNDFLPFLWEKKLKEPFNDQLKGLNEDSNPVIFYYEFK